MSQDELCFLPAIPLPDASEQQDKCLESSSKLVESNNSGSPLSEGGRPNGRAMNHASSPLEEDPGATHLKRKRKPSEKWYHGATQLMRGETAPALSFQRITD